MSVLPSAGGAVALTVSSADWLTSEDEVVLPPAPAEWSPEGVTLGALALTGVALCAAGLCAWSGFGLESAAWSLCAVLSGLVAWVASPRRA